MIKKIIFFGQGPHALFSKKWCEKHKIDFIFITSHRLKSQIDVKKILNGNSKSFVLDKLEKKFLEKLIDRNTIGFSAGSPFIFSKEVIRLFHSRIYNIHNAPLPEFRGGASHSWMILSGRRSWQSTIHVVDPGIDTGNIILKNNFIFPTKLQKPVELRSYQWTQDLMLLENFFNKLLYSKKIIEVQQDESKAAYYPRLNVKVNGWINFDWDNKSIERFIYAFSHDYGGARAYVDNRLIKIFSASCYNKSRVLEHPFSNGLVLYVGENSSLHVATGKGNIVINEYKYARKIRAGDRLYSPTKKLENALATRIKYLPKK